MQFYLRMILSHFLSRFCGFLRSNDYSFRAHLVDYFAFEGFCILHLVDYFAFGGFCLCAEKTCLSIHFSVWFSITLDSTHANVHLFPVGYLPERFAFAETLVSRQRFLISQCFAECPPFLGRQSHSPVPSVCNQRAILPSCHHSDVSLSRSRALMSRGHSLQLQMRGL